MKRVAEAWIPTKLAKFKMITYADQNQDRMPHVAMVHIDLDTEKAVLVRIHSECMTGDLFHSLRCDCGEQLDKAFQLVSEDPGVIIYLRQEGRGIGLINKLEAYNLQDKGVDTVEANEELGFHPDERNYKDAIEILKDLGIKKVRLLTNNPEKAKEIENSEISLVERVPIVIDPREENSRYLQVKKDKMGHLFD
jgi:3,4-dihydroxy 2-butanone 4-phosphate synthase/GTP cyclohydrolase II